MGKINCWEFKRCGREPGGLKADELGICAASIEKKADGINNGKNGGRACWPIAGTLCGGKVQGSYAAKVANCLRCEFYQLVGEEEGPDHVSSKEILAKIK